MIAYHSTEHHKRAARRPMPAAALNMNSRIAFAVAIALIALGSASPARAADCTTVTSTADDASSSSTSGTLRYAIAQANAGTCDTITITAAGTVTLMQGQLEISNTVPTGITIAGPGAANLAISGNNATRVFQIDSAVTASISGITIENGHSTSGGGIFNHHGTLTVTNSTFSGNAASYGGGIYSDYDGTLKVTNSTFSGNSASSLGGGMLNASGTTITVTNSTFSGNSAGRVGGGIFNDVNNGNLTVTNSTFSGNSASYGGGIYNIFGNLTVTNSTFSGNSAYAIASALGSTITVKNTLLANEPSGGNCGTVYGTLVSAGYNLSDDNTCTSSFTATGDLNNTPAGLDPLGLQNNGGPTQTIALVYGSPAIDAIPISACTDASGTPLYTDQRGAARPQPTGGNCDIGAYELVPATTPFATFTPKLNIYTGAVSAPGFDLNVALTLGANDAAIFPLTKDVKLTIGSYSVTVPSSSFKLLISGAMAGSYVYSGIINGVTLSEQLSPTGTNSYSFKASATGVVPATTNPVAVTLTIGTDSSTASVTARIQ